MDVLQRMGPMTVPHTAVAPLSYRAAATEADAAMLRRAFRSWIDPLADPDTVDDLSLAVYEALANVVDHAYASVGPDERPDRTMYLRAIASLPLSTGREVVVTVLDEGVWRVCDDPGWRGRGLPLMRRLTHTTSVVTGSAGTVVQLRRRVSPAP